MTYSRFRYFSAALFVLVVLSGIAAAASPEWTLDKKVSAIYPSFDSSTIVTSGNNLLYLTREGKVSWMDKPYDYVDVSGNGEYVIAAGPYATLYDQKGNKVWENENTGDSQSNDEPLKVKISRDASLILTYTSVKFHTWSVSGGQIGANTSYLVTEGNAYFSDVGVSPTGDEIAFFTTSGLYVVNRSGAPVSHNEDDWKCSVGILADDGKKAVCANDNRLSYGHTSGVLLWDKKIASDTITSIAVSSGSAPLIAAGSLDGSVYAVDATGNVLWSSKLFTYRVDQPITVSVSNDGSYVSARSLDTKTMEGAVFLFDRKGQQLFVTEGEDAVGRLLPDGSSLLVGTSDDLSSYSPATITSAAPTALVTAAETTAAPPEPTTAAVGTPATVPATQPATFPVPATTQKAPVFPVLALIACAVIAAAGIRRK